jgi:hypothetical protein
MIGVVAVVNLMLVDESGSPRDTINRKSFIPASLSSVNQQSCLL